MNRAVPAIVAAISLVFVLVFVFVSCGQQDAQPAAADQTAEQEEADPEAVEPAGATEDEATEDAERAEEQEVVMEAAFNTVEHEGVELSWRVNGQMLDVVLAYETTGWVSVGFDPTRQMQDANMIIGYVADGELSISDHFGTGPIRHEADTEIGGRDDVVNASGTESNGRTELRFSIPLDSGDSADRPLSEGQTYTVLLAYGPDGADDFTTYHGGRTSLELEI